eukprot:GEMP01003050.1.p1 GENE.GEMP01003050.1~~GEMP01003050.1.p1  ORF type:complete len:905 (+),score=126.71 GEMP01003050.1:258-2717(+)
MASNQNTHNVNTKTYNSGSIHINGSQMARARQKPATDLTVGQQVAQNMQSNPRMIAVPTHHPLQQTAASSQLQQHIIPAQLNSYTTHLRSQPPPPPPPFTMMAGAAGGVVTNSAAPRPRKGSLIINMKISKSGEFTALRSRKASEDAAKVAQSDVVESPEHKTSETSLTRKRTRLINKPIAGVKRFALASEPSPQTTDEYPSLTICTTIERADIADAPSPMRQPDMMIPTVIETSTSIEYSRDLLIQVWRQIDRRLTKNETMWVVERREDRTRTEQRRRSSRFTDAPVDRATVFGADLRASRRDTLERADISTMGVLRPGDNAYKIEAPKTRSVEILRSVRSLLNKICPDNLKTIVEQLAQITLSSAEELESVIRIVFKKALSDSHYCATYADMVFALHSRYPEFPPKNEGEKPVTFTRILLNTCQREFENLPALLSEPSPEIKAQYTAEECDSLQQTRKKCALANMKFIGNLFLRQLLSVKVINQIVHDLLGIKNTGNHHPEEHMIECVCELLKSIGYTLEIVPHGRDVVHAFISRLLDLKGATDENNRRVFSKRIQFAIQDIADLRADGWQQKVFKESAKKKDDIRMEAATEARASRSGKGTAIFTSIAGQRPKYIDERISMKQQKAAVPNRESFLSAASIRQILLDYEEQRDTETFCYHWEQALRSKHADNVEALGMILDAGFNESSPLNTCAEVISALLSREKITATQLKGALDPYFDTLEDLKLDVPRCEMFFHQLCTRLCLNIRNLDATIFKKTPPSREFAWELYIGTLKYCRDDAGVEGCKKVLPFVQDAMCKAKNYRPDELRRKLRELELL